MHLHVSPSLPAVIIIFHSFWLSSSVFWKRDGRKLSRKKKKIKKIFQFFGNRLPYFANFFKFIPECIHIYSVLAYCQACTGTICYTPLTVGSNVVLIFSQSCLSELYIPLYSRIVLLSLLQQQFPIIFPKGNSFCWVDNPWPMGNRVIPELIFDYRGNATSMGVFRFSKDSH